MFYFFTISRAWSFAWQARDDDGPHHLLLLQKRMGQLSVFPRLPPTTTHADFLLQFPKDSLPVGHAFEVHALLVPFAVLDEHAEGQRIPLPYAWTQAISALDHLRFVCARAVADVGSGLVIVEVG